MRYEFTALHDVPGLPPAIPLLVEEVASSETWHDARKVIKGLLGELRKQSEVYLSTRSRPTHREKKDDKFRVSLHGALDLFSGSGCAELPCRLATTDRLARSVGLIADEVWLHDTFSTKFLDFGRATNSKLDEVVADVVVLSRLSPLIQAEIVRFQPSLVFVCNDCHNKFEAQVESVANQLLRKFRKDFRLREDPEGGWFVDTGKCFDPPLVHFAVSRERSKPRIETLSKGIVADEVRSAFWVARDAAVLGGSVLSNSRIGLTGLLENEGRFPSRNALLRLEEEREISVPWVSTLEPKQIVELRQEASSALPSFRNELARTLAYPEDGLSRANSSKEVIARLREQADLVREELSSRRRVAARYWRSTYTLLGLGLSAYGVAADEVVAGAVGLLSTIQLLIEHKTGYESDVERLKHMPGYVLVKAQQLLDHAHDA
jgi:hypothetical protein